MKYEKIICWGCATWVSIFEEGLDRFGNTYKFAISRNSGLYIYYNHQGDWGWDGPCSEDRINWWLNEYLG